MSETRFVVEITRQVPADAVLDVSALIADRLEMDPERIFTLLNGRVGPVTKPVLSDKAAAIAEVFTAAGVKVAILPAGVTDGPSLPRGDPSEDASAATGEAGPAQVPEDEPGPELAEETPSQRAPGAREPRLPTEEWAAGQGYEWSEDEENAWPERPGGSPSEPWEGPVFEPRPRPWDATGVWADDESADWRKLGQRPGEARERAQHATPPPPSSPEAGLAGDGAEEEADRLGPREQRPDRGTFSTSTRWVPSPHDEYGFDPEEDPLVPSAVEGPRAWDEGGMAVMRGRGFGLGLGDAAHGSVEPPGASPRLRVYLMWGLIVSIVVFLLLQFVMADRVRNGAGASGFDAGLAAYRKADFASAIRAWEPEAEHGNVIAQYYLGYMAQNGLGQPWSNARAAGYYRRAAEGGLPEAQLALGDLYLRGMGVELDEGRGASLYAQAAASGSPRARFEYGKLLLHGRGTPRDPLAALAQFEAAAAAGFEAAGDFVAFAKEAAQSEP